MQKLLPLGWSESTRFRDTFILGDGEAMVMVQAEETPEGGTNFVTRVLGFQDFDGKVMEFRVRRVADTPSRDDAMAAARAEMLRLSRLQGVA